MKKLIGIGLIICGIFILFGSLLNGFGGWHSNGNQIQSRSASMDGVEYIEISGSGADINVIPKSQENLTLELKGDHADEYDLTVDRDGKTVSVELEQQWLWFNWFSFNEHLTMDVYIPETFDQHLAVDIGSGSFEFLGRSSADPMKLMSFELDIGSGNVDLGHLKFEQLTADVSSGNVDAKHINAGTAEIDISSGNMNLTQYSGSLSAEISSGKLLAQFSKLAAPIDVSISSGTVDLDLPQDADFTLNGDVSSGDIDSDFTLNDVDSDDDDSISGSHGTGKYPIDVDVSSGNINIY